MRSLWVFFQIISIIFSCAELSSTQTSTVRTRKSETRRFLPITAFYDTPPVLPPAKPGTLIRSEPIDDYDLSADMTARRILYHSSDSNGKDITASAVMLLPEGKVPGGGWPVIAWAHGFSGVARKCAPSLMKNLLDGPLLSMYLTLGYAVVVADYAGLGTRSRFAAVDNQANAMDVIYAIAAARVATPSLSSKWIAVGNSQGATVAIKIAELTADIGFLGSIAISGVAGTKDLSENLARQHHDGMISVLAYGVKTVYPGFKPEDLYAGDDAGERSAASGNIESSCAVPSDPVYGTILRPDWETNHYVQQFFARNEIGLKPSHAPLVVIAGDSDPLITATLTAGVFNRMCRQQDNVKLITYSGLDSAAALGASVRDQINWIQSRFAGKTQSSDCK